MTSVLFEYPKSSAFGRIVPKSKIYEHVSPSKALKELFVGQVDQIVWQYKLAPETINLRQTSKECKLSHQRSCTRGFGHHYRYN